VTAAAVSGFARVIDKGVLRWIEVAVFSPELDGVAAGVAVEKDGS
jgi:hypothetical protein